MRGVFRLLLLRVARLSSPRMNSAAFRRDSVKKRGWLRMALLEDLTPGVLVKGLLPGGNVTVISVKRHGSMSVELVYKDANGHLGNELLYSDGVENLEIAAAGLPWSFDADGSLFRLTSEAYRIR